MKYCTKCGAEIMDDAVICPHCGCLQEEPKQTQSSSNSNTLKMVAFVLMIVSTVSCGLLLIPLIWCIPMIIKVKRSMDTGEPLSTGFKVCTLLFVNLIAGVLLLCDNNQ